MICHLAPRLSQVSVQIWHRSLLVSIFRGPNGTFAAVDNGQVLTEKPDLSVTQPAVAGPLGRIRCVSHLLRLRIAFSVRSRTLKILGEARRSHALVVARGLGPMPLRIDHELGGGVVCSCPASLLPVRRNRREDRGQKRCCA